MIYRPPQSVVPFLTSDKFVNLQVGPVGSGKSTGGLVKILYEAKRIAPCKDGIRRSRCAVIRNCYDTETEVFTENGWEFFSELKPTTKVAALHGDKLVYETPVFHYAAPYKGKMVRIKNQSVDLLVTPDHELWLSSRTGRAKNWGAYVHTKAMEAYGKGETIRMNTVVANDDVGTQWSEDFYEFLGFWFADGTAGAYEIGGRTHYRLVVSQNPREDMYVENLLERNGLKYGTSVKKSGNINYNITTARVEDKERVREFATYGKALTKVVPRKYLDGVSSAQARAFLRGYQQGDGSFLEDANRRDVVRTGSKQLADNLHEFAVKAGIFATVTSHKARPPRGGQYDVVLHQPCKNAPAIQKHHWSTQEDFDGMVYCVEVSTHVILVRRRGKAVLCGQTRQMLLDATIPDFLKWFPEGQFGSYLRTETKFILKVDDVECEVLFRGLDDANDVRRLLSLQLSFGLMDEFREINPDIFNALTGRLGRYPDKSMNDVGCCDDNGKQIHKVWGMTNPPDMDTFWEKYLTEPPVNAACFFQPGGLSEDADWINYLPDGYYDNLAEGKSEDWIDVYINAKFGKSLSGLPVFRSFDTETHVSDTPLIPHPLYGTLLIGVDAGLTPAAVIGQIGPSGRLLIYDSIPSDNMGALRFVREKLKPLLAKKFPGYPMVVIIDPAAFQRAQTDERTVADIYRTEGFTVKSAKTNVLSARLASVDSYLTRTVDGNSGVVLCVEGCQPLIRAMRGGYRYKVNTKGEADDKPEKSHPASDLSDSFQYLTLHADNGATFGAKLRQSQAREVQKMRATGWT